VSKLDGTQQSASIIRGIIALAHGLKLSVVAEGVETEDQLGFLASEGCDEVQEHLFGRPGPIEQYAYLIGRSTTHGPTVPDAA
jgi:EAL domain-containing protein (putative c-di-GMP-specific phosphodiesterase class I)